MPLSLTEQERSLLRLLCMRGAPMLARELAAELGISERTLRNRVRSINERAGAEGPLVLSGQNGYACNRPLVGPLLTHHDAPSVSAAPQTREGRRARALKRVVEATAPVDLYDLCEELYVSISTMRTELGPMRRRCADFDLTLKSRGDRISIEGSEKNRRKLLAALLYDEASVNLMDLDTIQEAFPEIDVAFVDKTVRDTLDNARFFVNDCSLINLVLHLAIALDRIRGNGQCGELSPDDQTALLRLRPHEGDMAGSIARKLEARFGLPFSGAEEYELALLLASRTTTLDYRTETREDLERYVDVPCLSLVDALVKDMADSCFIDLSGQEFYVRFALHVKNLLARARSGSFARNPLTEEIRATCPLLYDAAVCEAGTIKRLAGVQIDDDEIAYLAFHLGAALETQKQLEDKVKVVIFCPAYYDIDKSLRRFLDEHFSEDVVITNVVTAEAELRSLAGTDLVITTNPLETPIDAEVLRLGIAPRQADIARVRTAVEGIRRVRRQNDFRTRLADLVKPELFSAEAGPKTREDSIHYLSEQLVQLGYADEHYESEVLERERLSSTAFGPVAVPHTMKPCALKSSISVLVPGHPVPWGEEQVSLVLMLAFSPDERATFNEVFEPLVGALLDRANVQRLSSVSSCEEFIERLARMVE